MNDYKAWKAGEEPDSNDDIFNSLEEGSQLNYELLSVIMYKDTAVCRHVVSYYEHV